MKSKIKGSGPGWLGFVGGATVVVYCEILGILAVFHGFCNSIIRCLVSIAIRIALNENCENCKK